MKIIRTSAVLLAAIALLLATFGAARPTRAATTIKVLASITIIQDIAQNVAGDKPGIGSIVPTDGDAHNFDPSPDDIKNVADAALILVNGARLEGFLQKLIDASGTKARVVEVSTGVKIKQFAEPAADVKPVYLGVSGTYVCSAAKEGEEVGECDPHFWQDPANVIVFVENIRAALAQIDPTNAATYQKNAADYTEKLKTLNADIESGLKDIAPENRVLVTNHDALGYFAARYNFRVAGVVLPGGSAGQITDPDPQQVADLIDLLKRQKIKAIFVENIASDKLATQIADEAGVKVVTGLYTDALGTKGTLGETYLGMMRANLKALQDALK